MGWGAMPDKDALRSFRSRFEESRFLRWSLSGSPFAAPPVVARLMGESRFLHHFLLVTFLVACVSLLRSISHCFLWPRALRADPPDDPRKASELGSAMKVELLVALAGVATSYLVYSTALPTASVGPAPFALVFTFLFGLASLATVLWTSHRAKAAGVNPTTEIVRSRSEEREVTEAASPLEKIPLLGWIYSWLTAKIPEKQLSAVAIIVIVTPFVLVIEGAQGVYEARAERWLQQTVAEQLESGSPGGSEQDPSGKLLVKQSGEQPADFKAAEARPESCSSEPGPPAPEPWARKLYALWYGSPKRDGAGNDSAGCPQPAEREPGRSGVWIERGVCGGTLEGLGVVSESEPGAMLFQGAARIAARFASEGKLLGASPRGEIGEGDFYVLQTSSGSYVAARSRRTYGSTEDGAAAPACGSYGDLNVPYQLAPPGLLGIWLTIGSQDEWVWPVEVGAEAEGSRFSFLTRDGERLGGADCSSDVACTGSYRGRPLPPLESPFVTAQAVKAIARE